MKRICGLISLFVLGTSACNQGDVVLDEAMHSMALSQSEINDPDPTVPDMLGVGVVAGMEQIEDGWRRPQLLNHAKPVLGAQWSNDGSGRFRMHDRTSGAWIEVHPKIERDIKTTLANGHMVHRGAGPDGGDVFFRIHPDRVEDFVEIKDDSAPAALDYEVTLGDGVVALRQLEDIVEFLDAAGAPRFRIPSPYLVDAQDKQIPVHLTIDGCAYDQDARPPWHRPIVRAGSRHCTIRATWNREVVTYPILVDPAWSLTTSMAMPRAYHTATLLPSGQVLVVGGINYGGLTGGKTTVAVAELYDPNTGTWATTGSTVVPHYKHTATALDPSGNVMIVGGELGISSTKTEIWHSDTGQFTTAAPLANGRYAHVAVAFHNGVGTSVLIAGGFPTTNIVDPPLSSIEIWDPISDTWSMSAALSITRGNVAATLLPDGKSILMSGGSILRYIPVLGGHSAPLRWPLDTAEIYNVSTGTTTATTKLLARRAGHTQTVLPNGTVMAIGGNSQSAEIFDPSTATWSLTGSMGVFRSNHTATLLNSGAVLVAGGGVSTSPQSSLAYLYEPALDFWQTTNSMMTSRSGHTATLLDLGRVLVTGGLSASASLASVEYYTE